MLRKIRTAGVALVAALAFSAVATASASAEGTYTSSGYPSLLIGSGLKYDGGFTTEGGTVECWSDFQATLNAESSNLTVKATYSGCRAFGFATATVNMNSCDYLFTTPVLLGGHSGPPVVHTWTIPVDVKCTKASEPIKVTAGNCEITIGEQNPGGHVIATGTTLTPGFPNDLDVQPTLTGINYTVTKDGFLCPFGGTGAKTGATYHHEHEFTLSSLSGLSFSIS